MTCARCGLLHCACRSGRTRVTTAAATPDEALDLAVSYLERRGWKMRNVIAVKRRQPKIGVMGYRAWEFTLRVER